MNFGHIFSHFLSFKIIMLSLLFSFLILFLLLIINLVIKTKINKRIFVVDYFLIFYILIISRCFFLVDICKIGLFSANKDIQLIPFKSIYIFFLLENYFQIIGNILVLIPLPILLQLRSLSVHTFKQSFLYTFLFSLIVESLQLAFDIYFDFRCYIFDVDDLILNTTGGIIGWCFFRFLYPYFIRK